MGITSAKHTICVLHRTSERARKDHARKLITSGRKLVRGSNRIKILMNHSIRETTIVECERSIFTLSIPLNFGQCRLAQRIHIGGGVPASSIVAYCVIWLNEMILDARLMDSFVLAHITIIIVNNINK